MDSTTLKAEPRTALGTRRSRALRTTGWIPAIIYGHGETPEAVSLLMHDFQAALARGARTLSVTVGGSPQPYLIKAVQYDHFASTPVHVDLARVSLDERVTIRIGIDLRGTPKGVAEGGFLDQHMAEIEVECLFTEIPGTLHPLVSDLALGQSLLVKDLQLPPGVKVLAEPGERIATVRALEEEPEVVETPAEGEEAAQPERIGRVKKEEGEES